MSADIKVERPDYAAKKPELKWQLSFTGDWPIAVSFVDGGQRLAAANQAGEIRLWNLAPGVAKETKPEKNAKVPGLEPAAKLVGHTNGVTKLVASPDGATLYSASLDHSVRAWDIAGIAIDNAAPAKEVKPSHEFTGHEDWIASLAISRDGKRLVSGDYGARVIAWDLATKKELRRWSGRPWSWIVALALTSNGERTLVSEYRYKRDDFDVPAAGLRLWNTADGTEKLDLLKVQFPKYDPLAATYDASQLWRKFVANGLIAADFSADDQLLALAQGGETDSGKIHILDAVTGKLVRDVSGHQSGATDVRFTDDGRFVLSTGRDTMLRICEVATGKEVAALGTSRGGQFKDWLSAFSISPDGGMIAAADIAGFVHVWSV